MSEIIFTAASTVIITALIIILSLLARCIYILLSALIKRFRDKIIVYRPQKNRN